MSTRATQSPRRQLLATASLAAALSLTLASCAGSTPTPGASSGEKPSYDVSLAVYPGLFLNLPTYVAQETGIFADLGIKADIVEIAGGPNQAAAVQSGDIDVFTFPVNSVLPLRAQGQEFTAIANVQGPAIYSIIGTSEAIKDCKLATQPYPKPVECLRNKPVGVAQLGGDSFVVLMSMLKDAGMTQQDVDLIQVGASSNLPSTFEGKQIQFAIGVEPAPMMLEKSLGLTETLVSLSGGDVGKTFNPWLGETLWAMQPAADAEPEKFNALREAMVKASAWMQDPTNRDEAVKIMMNSMKFDKPTAEGLADRQLGTFDANFSCAAFDNVQDYAVETGALEDGKRMTCDDVVWSKSSDIKVD